MGTDGEEEMLCQPSSDIILEDMWRKMNPAEAYNMCLTLTGYRICFFSAVCYVLTKSMLMLLARSDVVGSENTQTIGRSCQFLTHTVIQMFAVIFKKAYFHWQD